MSAFFERFLVLIGWRATPDSHYLFDTRTRAAKAQLVVVLVVACAVIALLLRFVV